MITIGNSLEGINSYGASQNDHILFCSLTTYANPMQSNSLGFQTILVNNSGSFFCIFFMKMPSCPGKPQGIGVKNIPVEWISLSVGWGCFFVGHLK